MTASLGTGGLTTESLAQIKEALREDYVTEYGTATRTADDTNIGKQIGIYSDRETAIQEAIEAVYWSQYLGTATGTSLDLVLERMGLQRQAATSSSVTMYAAGTASATVEVGALQMSVDISGELFANSTQISFPASFRDVSPDSIARSGSTVTVTISGGHSFLVDEFVFILGAEQTEYNGLQEITAVDATTFEYEIAETPTTPATGTFQARESFAFTAQSENTGPVQALAGTITTIEAGANVQYVENPDDATLGRNTETDAEVRTRAQESLSVLGAATQPAIIAKMLDIDGVTFATVFQNVTDWVDDNGLPPHSIRVVVDGGADQDIWDTLYEEAVSAGIQMDGTETTTITDSNGDEQPVAFSRPTQVRLYVDAGNGLTTNSDPTQGPVFPADGNDQIKANLAALEFQLGGDVWPAVIKEAINSVPGVITSDPEFDTSTPPTNKATIAISANDRANIDSDDVTF